MGLSFQRWGNRYSELETTQVFPLLNYKLVVRTTSLSINCPTAPFPTRSKACKCCVLHPCPLRAAVPAAGARFLLLCWPCPCPHHHRTPCLLSQRPLLRHVPWACHLLPGWLAPCLLTPCCLGSYLEASQFLWECLCLYQLFQSFSHEPISLLTIPPVPWLR